jgi:hypothetical protein
MTLPLSFFYAAPQFKASDAELAKLRALGELGPDSPGSYLAVALDYYRVEAFATPQDRDAACGSTAHEDVQYVPAKRKSLSDAGLTLDELACGYAIDHARFDETMMPILDAALKGLVRDLMRTPENKTGVIASSTVSIARVHYTILAVRSGDWIKFPVGGRSMFEKVDRDLVERTISWLQKQVMLKATPSLIETS